MPAPDPASRAMPRSGCRSSAAMNLGGSFTTIPRHVRGQRNSFYSLCRAARWGERQYFQLALATARRYYGVGGTRQDETRVLARAVEESRFYELLHRSGDREVRRYFGPHAYPCFHGAVLDGVCYYGGLAIDVGGTDGRRDCDGGRRGRKRVFVR